MAIDLKAKLAELKAKKAAETEAAKAFVTQTKTTESKTTEIVETPNESKELGNNPSNVSSGPDSNGSNSLTNLDTSKPLMTGSALGTAKTSEIDHIEFMSKMNALQQAIHTQHPTMPVLLMQIHKQLQADPEIVTLLSEEGIGVIVKGLQVQTKTELISAVVRESKTKAKKIALDVTMF